MGQRDVYELLKAYPDIWFDSKTISELLNYSITRTRILLRKVRVLKGIVFVVINRQMTDNKCMRTLYKYTDDE